jgi:hypothetical protein
MEHVPLPAGPGLGSLGKVMPLGSDVKHIEGKDAGLQAQRALLLPVPWGSVGGNSSSASRLRTGKRAGRTVTTKPPPPTPGQPCSLGCQRGLVSKAHAAGRTSNSKPEGGDLFSN